MSYWDLDRQPAKRHAPLQLSHHHRLAVASQRVLQEARQLGVAVGHVGALAVDQSRDDVSQCGEGEVDLGGFLQTLAGGARLALALRALGNGGRGEVVS